MNVGRIPIDAASVPPTSGPMNCEEKSAICSTPIAYATRSFGALAATSAVAAGIVPTNMPCKARSAKNCQTFWASPWSVMVNMAPT